MYMAFKSYEDQIVVQPVGHDLAGNEVPGTCDLTTAFRRAKILARWQNDEIKLPELLRREVRP